MQLSHISHLESIVTNEKNGKNGKMRNELKKEKARNGTMHKKNKQVDKLENGGVHWSTLNNLTKTAKNKYILLPNSRNG